MTVYESDLPGVGKKFEVELNDGSQLVIVIHNTGKRELFLRESPDSDSEKLFELSDRLSRQVGTIMEGAYFQPIRTETIDTVLSDETLIEWVKLTADSPLVGKTLAESEVRQRIGVSVVAVQRDDETISNPGADFAAEEGDILVVIGGQDACREFQRYVTAEPTTDE
ncbi:cation:proton antiporter regulatory subunit [Haloprofundus salilacus]|uniref:cation:proton antiporter regulatory subunit n=1 Tax=Haloprofundus salilacus TaxID=2876190 RepID=UPI001CCD0829|nr:TrkA C-terminal domain-containing protein [Haloprofundus salilacus]